MKILKSAVIAFSLAVAMGSFSTAAVAEAGRTTYKPLDAAKGVQDLISKAEAAANSGTNGEDLAALIKNAADFSEEINANDRVARENSNVAKHLKAAIKAAKANNAQESLAHMAKAKESLEKLKSLI